MRGASAWHVSCVCAPGHRRGRRGAGRVRRHRRVPAVGGAQARVRRVAVVHHGVGPQPQRDRPPTSRSSCSSGTRTTRAPRRTTSRSRPATPQVVRQRRLDAVRPGGVRRAAGGLGRSKVRGQSRASTRSPARRDSVGQFFAGVPGRLRHRRRGSAPSCSASSRRARPTAPTSATTSGSSRPPGTTRRCKVHGVGRDRRPAVARRTTACGRSSRSSTSSRTSSPA